jgi:DNA-3-methyladenine glycosylase II|tara:strand:- start:141 stop:752 length:612 start_codon:yes stop_codon:yes gene_type:complete
MNVSENWEVATKELSRNDPVIMKIIKLYSGDKMQLKNNAFLTLVRSVVGQQISVKAADSVWKKLEELCRDSIEPERIKSFSEDELRSAGLSRSKANYIQNIAKSDILEVDWSNLDDEEAINLLCKIKGIGRWTAEMFLIFHLARPNILPLGDIGLIKAIELNYNNGEKMSKEELEAYGQKWSPWCTVATWYLWRSLDPIPVNY